MATLRFSEGSEQPPSVADNAEQLLPNVVDGMAVARPEAIYAMIPKSLTSYAHGYRTVTYRELASCVNGVAWLLKEQLGSQPATPAIAYVGPHDISYICMILGAVKAGYALLCASPRFTGTDHQALFTKLNCKTLLTPDPPYAAAVETLLAGVSPRPRIIHVPSIYDLLSKTYLHFPYPKTYHSSAGEPIFLAHTSGSTGDAKPITYTHAFVTAYIRWMQAPPPDGHANLVWRTFSNRVLMSFPLFSPGALFGALFDYIFNQTILVTPLGGVPPSTQSVIECLKQVQLDTVILPPPFVEEVARSDELVALVAAKAKTVVFGGGDIDESLGNKLASHVTLVNLLGASETTVWPNTRSIELDTPEEWQYIRPHPYANIHFEPTTQPDLFEAVIRRNTEGSHCQPVFVMFPHLQEYRTRDLWSRHPRKPGLWHWRSRIDDMINFKAGFLCNPVPIESRIAAFPGVKAALMIGTGRFQPALLIEPTDPSSDVKDLLLRLGPLLDEVNKILPRNIAIAPSHVIFTEMDIPLPRAGKETIQRGPSLTRYKDHIDALYATKGDRPTADGQPFLTGVTLPTEIDGM